VESYLNGEGSQKIICEKFNISDPSVLRRWINLYTSGKEIQSTNKGRKSMNKGRKTTLKERVEIVQYTIANDFNYHETSEKYQLSYQQAYRWVRKHHNDRDPGLPDRRGASLESNRPPTDEEKLQLRINELGHPNQYVEAEN